MAHSDATGLVRTRQTSGDRVEIFRQFGLGALPRRRVILVGLLSRDPEPAWRGLLTPDRRQGN